MIEEYGHYTLFDYLTAGHDVKPEDRLTPEEAVLFENLFSGTGVLHFSLLNTLMEDVNFDEHKRLTDLFWERGPLYRNVSEHYWYGIEDGAERIIDAMFTLVGRDKVKLNRRVRTITKTPSGVELEISHTKTSSSEKRNFDKVLLAVHATSASLIEYEGFNESIIEEL